MSNAVYTWKKIKEETLRKMFALNGENLLVDSNNREYVYGMPQACNEALQLLWTSNKHALKSYTITNRPLKNLLTTGWKNYQIIDDSAMFDAVAKSYYFEAQGKIHVSIDVAGVLVKEIDIDSPGYTVYKGLIENPAGDTVTMTFAAEFPANIRNVCMYGNSFATDEDVFPYGEYLSFNLRELVEDFYEVDSGEIYRFSDNVPRYMKTDDYFKESRDTIVIPRSDEGIFKIYYRAYPPQITHATSDDYELPVDPEIGAIIPLYMASQLYKEDDIQISTIYRNEFEEARDSLSNGDPGMRKEEFVSASGWV